MPGIHIGHERESVVSTPNFVLYGLNRLGPKNIAGQVEWMKETGATTIIIGMFHIGNVIDPTKKDMKEGDIIFNGDEPLVIRDGRLTAEAADWPAQIAQLKGSGSSVTKIYASVGGASSVVRDFQTIKKIYDERGQTFTGTQLQANFAAFRKLFPAIDGIDMDLEETYDLESFVAFCVMLIDLGFEISFCPYERQGFWTKALLLVENERPNAVKWWNLQCYDGGSRNVPQDWAQAIAKIMKRDVSNYSGYIVPGDWVRFWDPNDHYDLKLQKFVGPGWNGNCPADMTSKFHSLSTATPLGGGFIWDLDSVRASQEYAAKHHDNGCDGKEPIGVNDYIKAIKTGLGM
jgi:hypothetical protein